MTGPRQAKISIHMADEAALEEARLILQYEAAVRGMTMGQVASELVMKAVDIESYPPELRNRLAEIEAEAERRAVERSLRASRLDDGPEEEALEPPGAGAEG